MASILRKPVPPPRTHSHAQAYSYAAAPSISDDDLMVDHTTPSSYSDHLDPTTTCDSNHQSKATPEVKESQLLEHQKTSPWGVHWTSPALMLGLFLLGIASAVGHHLFYQALDNTAVGSQAWSIRIGTGLAFITKAALAAAVGIAYTQRLWVTLKKKSISMQCVDDLFLLTMDPTSFFSWEVFKMAKLLCIMAASMWCIPLIATITPATLSVSAVATLKTANIGVPILNFNNENSSSQFYTDFEDQWLEMPQPIASISLRRLLKSVATGGVIQQITPQFVNHTYELQFFGPSLKCYNLTAPTDDPVELGEITLLRTLFNHTLNETRNRIWGDDGPYGVLGPAGEEMGYAKAYLTTSGHIAYWGMNGENLYPNPMRIKPFSQEALEDTSVLRDTFHFRLDWEAYEEPPSGFLPLDFSCNIWNSSYNVVFTSSQGEQSATITKLERMEQFHLEKNDYGPKSGHTPSQLAYKGYSDALRLFLEGMMGWGMRGDSYTDIELVTSSLAFCPELLTAFQFTGRLEEPWLCRNGSLLKAVEDLAQNFTLSMLSSPALSETTTVSTQVFSSENRYAYNWQNLAMAYSIGIAFAFFGVVVGGFSYVANGFSASTSFSRIIMTTRNPDLDKISKGRCLPALPLGKELGKVKLRYGMLRSEERIGHEHAAFGFSSTIETLKKGTKCV